jgi:AAA family ATP:ADP antiporter
VNVKGVLHTQAAALWRSLRVEPGEAVPAALAAAAFFFILCGYFVIRAVREAIGLQGSIQQLSGLFIGTAVATLIANPLFSALVGRFPRRIFIPLTYRFFMLNLLAFFVFLRFFPQHAGIQAGRVFFVWLSVFSLFATAVFWALLADGFTLAQGKRLFGLIAVGGTLGAITGAALTQQLVHWLKAPPLLLLAMVMLEAAVQCLRILDRRFAATRSSGASPSPWPAARFEQSHPVRAPFAGLGALRGITLTLKSPYLTGTAAYIVLIAVAATFFYFAQARIIKAFDPSREVQTEIFATIDLWTQSLTLMTQLFLTGRIMRWLGVGAALVFLPAMTMAGMLGLWAAPVLPVLMLVQVLNRAGTYAIARPARETLFTVLSREEKYKAKSLIDTFVYRTGDVAGAATERLLTAAFGIAGVAKLALPLSALWAAIGLWLARKQNRLAETAALAEPIPSRRGFPVITPSTEAPVSGADRGG